MMSTRNTEKSLRGFKWSDGIAKTRIVARFSFTIAFLLGLASISLCCSIPVFRYALEHWRPELFLVHVISSSPLDASQKSLVNQLEKSSSFANARVVVSDGKNLKADELKSIVDKAVASNSVWLAVESTKKVDGAKPLVWSAPLTKEAVTQLLSSPVRNRLCQGLVDKDSVAWIFLESGIPAVDDAKFAKLDSELRRLEKVIKLPVIEEADLKDLSTRPEELKVKFSAHRLSRSDPTETAFISMLLATEPDLQEEFDNGTPMAFPVFGRGRVLYGLLGDGIATSTIEEACRFLAGACQCTVKADNPGVDLLVSFDWDDYVQITEPKKADDVPLTGLGAFAKPAATVAEEPQMNSTESDRLGQSISLTSKVDVDSELKVMPPKPGSTPSSTLLTLAVLTAIVGIVTVSWKFLFGPKP